jgi:hypothetical protein
MVIGTCKINDGKSDCRFRNVETNTESTTAENGKASFSLNTSPPEKQEYPALTKFFHRKFMKGHSIKSDTVSVTKNNVAFRAQMPEHLIRSSVTCGIALEAENSSVSSVVSSGDCNDSASPCCMNECCSASSTITSDSSDPSANCKTDSKYKYSKIPELKLANGRNDEIADQSICTNENMNKIKDVDNILLSNLNTSGASNMQSKLENKNIEVDGSEGRMITSMLNLDLSSIKDDDNSANNSKQSKCWKSPEEVRLGYGRVAALAKHFTRLGDSGLIRIRGRGGCRGRSRPGLWREVFKSVPDMSRICHKKESNWDFPVPVRQTLPQSFLDYTNSSSCSHVYGVGLGAVSHSMDHLSLGYSSDDLDVQDQYKSCEELVLQDNSAEFKMAGSGDKEFETVVRQLKDQERIREYEDASHSRHTRSEENVQVLTEMGSERSQLQCCNSSSNGCMQEAQHEVSAAKHRAFIILASRGTPVKHSKSEGSIIPAVPSVGSYQNLPLFTAERPRSEDNILKVGLSYGDVPSWDKERHLHAETENHLRSCLKFESAVLPSQMKFCRLVDCRPKSEDNILLLASAQDRVYPASGGNEVRRNLEAQSASADSTHKEPEHTGCGLADSTHKEPEHTGCGLSALTRCKQRINYLNAVMCWCYYLSNFSFICLYEALYNED